MRTALTLALTLAGLARAASAAAYARDAPPSATPLNGSACRVRIEQVRAQVGLPGLDRDTATGERPLLIAAVDKRIGGCAVMVMRNNFSDIRPVPGAPHSPARMRRLQ